jgi:hypothetical protein
MGPVDPWSPNWRPDPSGRRLAMIRASRRGALLAGLVLWPLIWLAILTSRIDDTWTIPAAILVPAFSWPALALLGAGLGPAALGSKVDGVVAGLALAIGAPVAAVTSTAIGSFILAAVLTSSSRAAETFGLTVRTGVLEAIRMAPWLAAAAVIWVIAVRRWSDVSDAHT